MSNIFGISDILDGTLDFSSDIAMPLDSNASVDGRAVTVECAEPRRGLTQSQNSAPSVFGFRRYFVFRGDKSLDLQTVPTRGSGSGAQVSMPNTSKKGTPIIHFTT
jgi:hypothetical protein